MPSTAPAQAFDLHKELEMIEKRIVHALEIFPFLSISGIHQQIGTSMPKGVWQPVLYRLVEEGVIRKIEVSAQTPLDRAQSYTIFHLATNTYTPANDRITVTN